MKNERSANGISITIATRGPHFKLPIVLRLKRMSYIQYRFQVCRFNPWWWHGNLKIGSDCLNANHTLLSFVLQLQNLSCRSVPRILTDDHIIRRTGASLQFLKFYHEHSEDISDQIRWWLGTRCGCTTALRQVSKRVSIGWKRASIQG